MRVLIAPDKFAGTMSAPEAARAIAEGWARRSPDDELVSVPMSDGGPGFVDVLHAALGGVLEAAVVSGPYGAPTPSAYLRVGDTAYVESAQAAGLALTPNDMRRPLHATTRGVGELVRLAVADGATRVVIGLGGSATNDAGAGLLAALGATSNVPLDEGPAGFAGIQSLDLSVARATVAGVEIVAATDVDTVLLGILGATKTFGPQKGLSDEELVVADGHLMGLAQVADRKLADAKGAGAAGGMGYALMLLGATRVSGIELVSAAVCLAEQMRGCDLVITGEGSFDFSSRSGKVPYGVAELAADELVPCIALAGSVLVGSREMRALGVESAYSMVDLYGEDASFSRPAETLSLLAERVARTWSRE